MMPRKQKLVLYLFFFVFFLLLLFFYRKFTATRALADFVANRPLSILLHIFWTNPTAKLFKIPKDTVSG